MSARFCEKDKTHVNTILKNGWVEKAAGRGLTERSGRGWNGLGGDGCAAPPTNRESREDCELGVALVDETEVSGADADSVEEDVTPVPRDGARPVRDERAPRRVRPEQAGRGDCVHLRVLGENLL